MSSMLTTVELRHSRIRNEQGFTSVAAACASFYLNRGRPRQSRRPCQRRRPCQDCRVCLSRRFWGRCRRFTPRSERVQKVGSPRVTFLLCQALPVSRVNGMSQNPRKLGGHERAAGRCRKFESFNLNSSFMSLAILWNTNNSQKAQLSFKATQFPTLEAAP